MNIDEFGELSAAAAVGALTPDEQRAYEAALAQHPEWVHIARADADTAAVLASATTPVPPPAHLRDDLLARIGTLPQGDAGPSATADDAAPADPFETDEDYAAAGPAPVEPVAAKAVEPAAPARTGSWGPRGWFALAASLVLLLALGFGAVTVSQVLNRPAAVVALEQIEQAPDAATATVDLGDGGTATAHWSSEIGRAVLVSDDMPELDADKAYELWFVRDGQPLAAGLMDTAGGATSAVLNGDFHSGDIIAVTVEQAGGSPDGKPTSEPIVAIPTA
jgi:anti-sigma-K factor RskA